MKNVLKTLSIIAVVASSTALLFGCSLDQARAKAMNNFELCKATYSRAYTDNAKGVALDELRSRNSDCRAEYEILDSEQAAAANYFMMQQQNNMQQQQIRNQNYQNLINSMQNQNRQTNCRSYFSGDSMQTYCN